MDHTKAASEIRAFCKRLNSHRAERYPAGKDFASKVGGILGRSVDWTTEIYPIERGWLMPSAQMLRGIADGLRMAPADLLLGVAGAAPRLVASIPPDSELDRLRRLLEARQPGASKLAPVFRATGVTAVVLEPWLEVVEPADALEWIKTGLDCTRALRVRRAGLSPAEFEILRTHGHPRVGPGLWSVVELYPLTRDVLTAAFWVRCRLPIDTAAKWSSTGWDLLAATCWVTTGISRAESLEWWRNSCNLQDRSEFFGLFTPHEVRGWRNTGLKRTEWERWVQTGAGAPEAAAWSAAGFAAETAAEWRALDVASPVAVRARDVRVNPEVAGRWIAEGWDLDVALGWVRHRIDLGEAERWIQVGVDPETATRLLAQGVGAAEARRWLESGINVDHIAQWIEFGFDADVATSWSFTDPWRARRALLRGLAPEIVRQQNEQARRLIESVSHMSTSPIPDDFMSRWPVPPERHFLPSSKRQQRNTRVPSRDTCEVCYTERARNGTCLCP